ncbi:hypothetical protein DQP57_00525 [Mycobacterium colombiense]|uniref:Uncharacterized protein n=1 Tax=Mycobacterium colombiense TaxID=339268 RepID=A0A329MFU5_9MYCO|nr:hypothetical protein [Mycobacterium colombiense]RAV17543.1 hypothetical protein DQP57_00525 [Mycobacterium colombiense]
MEPKTEKEYQDNKLPFVKTQYGVFDPSTGKVVPCKSREYAHGIGGRFIPMVRHVSEWLEDKGGE